MLSKLLVTCSPNTRSDGIENSFRVDVAGSLYTRELCGRIGAIYSNGEAVTL